MRSILLATVLVFPASGFAQFNDDPYPGLLAIQREQRRERLQIDISGLMQERRRQIQLENRVIERDLYGDNSTKAAILSALDDARAERRGQSGRDAIRDSALEGIVRGMLEGK